METLDQLLLKRDALDAKIETLRQEQIHEAMLQAEKDLQEINLIVEKLKYAMNNNKLLPDVDILFGHRTLTLYVDHIKHTVDYNKKCQEITNEMNEFLIGILRTYDEDALKRIARQIHQRRKNDLTGYRQLF